MESANEEQLTSTSKRKKEVVRAGHRRRRKSSSGKNVEDYEGALEEVDYDADYATVYDNVDYDVEDRRDAEHDYVDYLKSNEDEGSGQSQQNWASFSSIHLH